MISIVVTTWWHDYHYLPHALYGILDQEYKDWEIILTMKMRENDKLPQHTQDALNVLRNHIRIFKFPEHPNVAGNPERNAAMKHANGEYITWLSGDNMVYPHWLATHMENLKDNPKAISVVNINYWCHHQSWGIFPKELAYARFDLTNMLMPTDLARNIDAFGEWCIDGGGDWRVFEKCVVHNKHPYVWHPGQRVCACHV